MAKWANDLVMDAALDYIAGSTRIDICSAQPTNATEATSTYTLGNASLTGGDFTKADGGSSGRKVTVASKSATGSAGTATHIALTSSGVLRYVTTCTSQSIGAGATVTIPAWAVTIADPT